MKMALMAVTVAMAALSGTAVAADNPAGWKWDAPAATTAPQPLPAPPLHCDPRPGVALPPECAQQAPMPDVENVEDALKPPSMQGTSGSNRAKKASQ